jgi:hypothetical protein
MFYGFFRAFFIIFVGKKENNSRRDNAGKKLKIRKRKAEDIRRERKKDREREREKVGSKHERKREMERK